jgi:hypothetical protein
MGELNSVSVAGIPGISNSFSAALWSIDTRFNFASAGVDGVNWATPLMAFFSFRRRPATLRSCFQ